MSTLYTANQTFQTKYGNFVEGIEYNLGKIPKELREHWLAHKPLPLFTQIKREKLSKPPKLNKDN